ncbi:MAG: succinate dehydrogenase, hydrophobic membrane anchor protein [Paracoccaceae bacterium]|jgi:succinate dehydrogenase / fumarate reductase membrane anchor subunit|nr:succinate dehydrogenase, hydrophobic membrane anchor protein [Paracoccaceae bacterium]
MAFLTDRKRAAGMGSAKQGTEHHWSMMVSSAALLILVPLFIFTFGAALGGTYEEVIAYYSRPVPAVIAALTLWVGFMHFKSGVQVLIEDYVHGVARKIAIIAMIILSYGAAAAGVFAIARLAI